MVELKTKKTDVSPAAFLRSLSDEKQRADALRILKMMRAVTGMKPTMWGDSIIGFGTYDYKYDSGHEGTCFVTGFAPRKGKLSLYLMSGFERYAALLQKLGKHKTGKACLYIKKLDDVDWSTLCSLVKASVADVKARAKPKKSD